jgi:hypothetical protein
MFCPVFACIIYQLLQYNNQNVVFIGKIAVFRNRQSPFAQLLQENSPCCRRIAPAGADVVLPASGKGALTAGGYPVGTAALPPR